MALKKTVTAKNILARTPTEQLQSRGVTIASGQNLDVGTVLGKVTATGLYSAYSNSNSDGTQTALGILQHPCDATGGNQVAGMYVRGAFLYDQLTGIDAAAVTELGGRVVGNELYI